IGRPRPDLLARGREKTGALTHFSHTAPSCKSSLICAKDSLVGRDSTRRWRGIGEQLAWPDYLTPAWIVAHGVGQMGISGRCSVPGGVTPATKMGVLSAQNGARAFGM